MIRTARLYVGRFFLIAACGILTFGGLSVSADIEEKATSI